MSLVERLFRTIDARDAEGFAAFLSDDACFVFGNAPAVHGRAAIHDAVAGFFASLGGLTHHVGQAWEMPNTVLCHGRVTYQRLDGSRITLPFANILGMHGPYIADYRVFADTGPLFASAREPEQVRQACLAAARRGYEEAGILGLCADGRWEHALGAVETLDLERE